MLLPIRTNVINRKKPLANYGIIILNIVIFLATYYPHRVGYSGQVSVLRDWATQFQLNPAEPFLWQFITYAFLHANFMHIFGNMFFLFIFGNNVNDKLGNLSYICFYLAGGIIAGFGHSLLYPAPVPLLGASGAVAAVTGAYLVLFPKTLITVLYWFIFIGTVEIPAMYFIIFKLIVWDNVIERQMHSVAYDAHLSGYFFGILVMLIMLALGFLPKSNYDLWAMLKRWHRRKVYQDAVGDGFNPFSPIGRNSKYVHSREAEPQLSEQDKKILELKSEINRFISIGNLSAAAEKYLELVGLNESEVIARQSLLDVANQLMAMGKWQESAAAYQKFLNHYGGYEYAEQVELMLGLLYSRYLNDREKALKYLKSCSGKLRDAGQKKMCNEEINKME